MLKRGCKGASQIDWIISFSIFIVYLWWFFIFIVPSVQQAEGRGFPEDFNSKLVKNVTWEVKKVPVIIHSNYTLNSEPVILNFTLNWSNQTFAMRGNNFSLLDEGRLLFLANLSKGSNVYFLVSSEENYGSEAREDDLNIFSNEISVNSKGFKVGFKDGLLRNLSYNGKAFLNSTEYYSGSVSLNSSSSSITKSPVIGKAKFNSQGFNVTTYVFARNERAYSFVDSNVPFNFSITASYNLKAFTSYFANNLFRGTINYSNPKCFSFNSTFVDLYNPTEGLSFFMAGESGIRICNDNETLRMNITIPVNKSSELRIYAHSGSYNGTLNLTDAYIVEIGSVEKVFGISQNRTLKLNSTSYESLKEQFSIKSEFSFSITNDTNAQVLIVEKKVPGDTDDVFVKSFDCWLLDKYGEIRKCKINLKSWE